MATPAEKRWISENASLAQSLGFSDTSPDGAVAQFVVKWYNDQGANAPQPDATDTAIFTENGYEVNPNATADQTPVPLEQGLLDTYLNDYVAPDLAADKKNREAAQQYVDTANRSLDQYLNINNEALDGSSFDVADYYKRYPGVLEVWQSLQDGPGGSTKAVPVYNTDGTMKVVYMTSDQFAPFFQQNWGKNEGKTVNEKPSTQLTRELNNADTTSAQMKQAAADAAATRVAALDQRKAEMTAELSQMEKDKTGALDAQTAALRQGLAELETQRQAALDQLNTARLAAAETLVTGVNQGLQSERDRITAQNAAQGYIGGSTMQDAALARATIDARQQAAQAIGSAKVSNAADTRTLGDEMATARFNVTSNDANARRGISDEATTGRFNLADTVSQGKVGSANTLASDTQNAANTGTKMRAAYLDNDYARRLQAALAPATVAMQRTQLLDLPGQVGSQGMTRTLNNLNWWSATPSMPQTNPTQTTASNMGNQWSQLGSGLFSGAMNIGNSIGWDKVFSSGGSSNGLVPATQANYDNLYSSGIYSPTF